MNESSFEDIKRPFRIIRGSPRRSSSAACREHKLYQNGECARTRVLSFDDCSLCPFRRRISNIKPLISAINFSTMKANISKRARFPLYYMGFFDTVEFRIKQFNNIFLKIHTVYLAACSREL